MGCNCGKNKGKGTPPLGGKGGQSQQEKQREGAKSLTAGGGGYVLEKLNGQTERFSRQLDASAARVRAGGGTIRPL